MDILMVGQIAQLVSELMTHCSVLNVSYSDILAPIL